MPFVQHTIPFITFPFPHASSLFIAFLNIISLLLTARSARFYLERLILPSDHHYHAFSEEKKRSISTQIGMLFLPRLCILLFWQPILKNTGIQLEWTEYHSKLMDGMSTVYISMYLFDLTHRNTDLDFTIHHIVSITGTLYMQELRYKYPAIHPVLTLFFVPFFVPGIVFADPLIDLSSLVYSLASRKPRSWGRDISSTSFKQRGDTTPSIWKNVSASIIFLYFSATAHLLLRLIQWNAILLYAYRHWHEFVGIVGNRVIWTLPIALCGWAKMEFTDVYILFLFPGKLVRRRINNTPSELRGNVDVRNGKKSRKWYN